MPPGIDLTLHVHYGFVWLCDEDSVPPDDLMQTRGGQQNGILGGAITGVLAMITGLHTGAVPFRVEVWPSEPALGEEWEEVVEVDFHAASTLVALSTFDARELIVLPDPGLYRARYCASGMDAAHQQDTRMDDDPVVDRYLLAMWPAAPAPERVFRQTGTYASYWAREAQQLPVARVPTAVKRRAADVAAREERRREQDLAEAAATRRRWQGIEPTPAMLRFGPRIASLARESPEIAELIVTSDEQRLRDFAIWSARQVFELAGRDPVDWTIPLHAVERGESPPPPFDNAAALREVVFPSATMKVTAVFRSASSPPGQRTPTAHPSIAAFGALLAIQHDEAAMAAMGAFQSAASAVEDSAEFSRRAREFLSNQR